MEDGARPGARSGDRIGPALSVNAVRDYLAELVKAKHLPDKLLLIHEFTPTMLPDRAAITPRPGVEIVFHADGFGTPGEKLGSWRCDPDPM